MKFFDYKDSERREWLATDITRAYLEVLRERMEESFRIAVENVSAGELHTATVVTGRARGLNMAVEIALDATK